MTRQSDERPQLKRPDEFDELFGRANPNPDRVGCPPADVLSALARRQRPIEDRGYAHLAECSPCYLEVRGIQESLSRQQRQRTTLTLSAAAVLLLIIGGLGWHFREGARRDLLQAQQVSAELDLRPYATMRSAQPQAGRKPLILPRGHLSLTMLLPVGSEPGSYDVQVLDAQLTSRASARGSADLQNQVTSLHATLELASVTPGGYQLAVRRDGEDWQLFPAQVQ